MLWLVPVVAVGVFALTRWAKHASVRDEEREERRRADEAGRAARALDDVAATPFPEELLAPVPRPIATHIGRHPELRAPMNEVLRRGTLTRGVILTIENTTSEEGLGPDEVRIAYRDDAGDVMIHTLVGDSWLYRGRPAWCRVRRPVSVLHDAGDVVIFEEVMGDLLVARDARSSAPPPATAPQHRVQEPHPPPALHPQACDALPTPHDVDESPPAIPEDRGAVPLRGRALLLRAVRHGLSFKIVPGADVVMGRTAERADLVAPQEGVSRRHARFTHDGDALHVEDLQSTPGVFVNGERIRAPRRLHAGDVVHVGTVQFTVVNA